MKQASKVATHIMKNKLKGNDKYPLVLMLEPLFRCNLECAGCGKIQYPDHILKQRMSVDEALEAADECGAPMVSIAGGEPLLHPEIDEIAQGLVDQGRFVYLCTNTVPLKNRIDDFEPSPYFGFSVHMDGLQETHDRKVCEEGVFEKAVEAIKMAKDRGFRVTTNTTVFSNDDPQEIREMFDFLMNLDVDGMMISPGYAYEKAPDQEHFLQRQETQEMFREILENRERKDWDFNHSPLYLEFLEGGQDYRCTAWSNPTRNVFGWQKPCYLLQDGYVDSYQELIEDTDWDSYGTGNDPRCNQCMAHCGYEGTATNAAFSNFRDAFKVMRSMVAA